MTSPSLRPARLKSHMVQSALRRRCKESLHLLDPRVPGMEAMGRWWGQKDRDCGEEREYGHRHAQRPA